ncbi:MAG: trypsin-like peptidase domain-containing protein [Pseudanabaena sp. ELA607]|jgi:hypothetical protein
MRYWQNLIYKQGFFLVRLSALAGAMALVGGITESITENINFSLTGDATGGALATWSSAEAEAKRITVYLQVPGVSGSGVLMQRQTTRQGDTYTVITAYHVVSGIVVSAPLDAEGTQKPLEEAFVITPDQRSHRIATIRKLDGLDLAVVTFTTRNSPPYSTARITNPNQIRPNKVIYVAGFPKVKPGEKPRFQFSAGELLKREARANDDGYGISYGNKTTTGISGGSVLNYEGELIGIHGAAKPRLGRASSKYGLAIPINLFMRQDGKDQDGNLKWSIYSSHTPSILKIGEDMRIGRTLTSANSCFSLIMQSDGNLVLYENLISQSLWSSDSAGKGGQKVQFQRDGNLVLFNSMGNVLWKSDTHGQGASRLQVQNDGNVVIYRNDESAVWSTNTGSADRGCK